MRKKSLKILGLLTFSLKWNLFYGEQRRRRLHGHTNKSPQKYTNRLNGKRTLPGSNMQVRFNCTS